jgi:hypothetical protein
MNLNVRLLRMVLELAEDVDEPFWPSRTQPHSAKAAPCRSALRPPSIPTATDIC